MSDDLFAIYGTEFEELEEDEVASSQKPAAVQDQIVTDERGRRRFHGAFSGGFSAGYFNTVGSKEGWKPQEFRSSRDQRALQNQQRPEDIMDEEDLGEFGVGGRRIRQSATFGSRGATDGSAGGTKRRLAWEHTGEESSNMAQQLEKMIRPVSDSIGVRMLRGMGWREGRGVGLATGKHKHKRSQGDSDDDGSFHKEQMSKLCSGFELSLEDELVQHLRPLSGTHGLGYEGLRQTNVLDQKYGSSASALKLDKKGKGIRGQAFGVGAFEVEDDSVYSNYDLSQYDFAIGGGSRHEKEPEAPSVDSTFEEMPKRLRPRPFFAAPRLPPNFKPEHKPIAMPSEKLPTGVQNAFKAVPISQRSRLLGEDRFSVMELLKDGDRKRLAQAKSSGSRWNRDESNEEGTSEGAHDKDRIAFPDEPMKQKRFKEFLNYLKRGLSYPQPSDMSVWEWEAEKGDFEAKLSCEERSMLPEVCARAKPLAKSALAMPMKELLQNKFTKETGHSGKADRGDEDKLAAVKSGMFGPLTRTKFEWYPDNVLAKRFNVPHPYPGSHLVGVPHLKKVAKTETMLNLGLPNTENELIFRRSADKQVDSHRRSEHGGDTEGDAPPTVIPEKPIQIEERPPDALFDAIFGPSSSESEDEPEPERPQPSTAKVLPRESPDKGSSPTPTQSSRVSQEKGEEEESDEYGPAPPPSSSQTGLSGFSVLRYLQEELERKKRKKKKSKESHKKHKKVKKEKKSKKGKKSEKKKKKKKSTTASSSSSSSSDSDIEVLS